MLFVVLRWFSRKGGLLLVLLGGFLLYGELAAQGRLHAVASSGEYVVYSVYLEYASPEDSLRNLDSEKYGEALATLRQRAQEYLRFYIYGAAFEYRPHSNKYGVAESFSTSPHAVELLQENVLVDEAVHHDALSFVYRYSLAAEELDYRSLWENGIFASYDARGVGDTPEDAFSDALRRAIREPMRKRTFNKPRVVSGRLVLNKIPREYFFEGKYVCEVQVLIVQSKITPYDAAFLR